MTYCDKCEYIHHAQFIGNNKEPCKCDCHPIHICPVPWYPYTTPNPWFGIIPPTNIPSGTFTCTAASCAPNNFQVFTTTPCYCVTSAKQCDKCSNKTIK